MKKIAAFLALVLVLSGCEQLCQECKDKKHKKRTGSYDYLIKVCAIGDTNGSSCVEYKADKFHFVGDVAVLIRTVDGKEYTYNLAGWAIIKVDM